jgi:hypothetical protein
MKTAVTPFGTVGGSVIRTAKVPDCEELPLSAAVDAEPSETVVVPKVPRLDATTITMIAISAAIAPENNALLIEFMKK